MNIENNDTRQKKGNAPIILSLISVAAIMAGFFLGGRASYDVGGLSIILILALMSLFLAIRRPSAKNRCASLLSGGVILCLIGIGIKTIYCHDKAASGAQSNMKMMHEMKESARLKAMDKMVPNDE